MKSFMALTVQFKKAADGFVENSGGKDSEMVSGRDGYALRCAIR